MKAVIISDTHNQHQKLDLPEGEMLIHAGDVSLRGTQKECMDFLEWFSRQDFMYKILIAGNHDFYFERESAAKIKAVMPNNIIYLKDSGTEINGLKFWGSPIQPWFMDWAFNRQRGKEIRKHWDLIPQNTDVLITHGPAYGILDKVGLDYVGCKDLLNKINSVQPRYFICGHIHEGYGMYETEYTTFINASVLDERYQLRNKPVVIDL